MQAIPTGGDMTIKRTLARDHRGRRHHRPRRRLSRRPATAKAGHRPLAGVLVDQNQFGQERQGLRHRH